VNQHPRKHVTWLTLILTAVLAGGLSACGANGGADGGAAGGAAGGGEPAGAIATLAETDMAPADPAARADIYTAPAEMGIDGESYAYFATIATNKGNIVVELFPDVAPQHVNSFAFLSEAGFYDGLSFHRVVPGFVIQGGDPTGTGGGGPGYLVPGEFMAENPVPHRVGSLAMARTPDPNSAGSQWYIVLEDGPSATKLNGQYTVFGHVIEGLDVVQSIAMGDTMTEVDVYARDASESVVSSDDIRNGMLPGAAE
jgi:cyclophilin family peptidyl-prolyl cis-trans isomerase